MTLWLKQSTARTIHIGPFLDDTDGKTAETGLTLSQADVRLSKNGADIAQKNESSACTHDELGYYTCPLDTTDTATLGHLKLMVHESGALPVFMDMMVVPANVWDSMFGSDKLDVNVAEVEGADPTDTIRDAVVDDSTRIDASALNTLSGHDPGEVIMGATDLGTGSGLTSLATAAELAKVPKSDGSATWNATALAALQSEAADALTAYDPPTKAELDSGLAELNDLDAAGVRTAVGLAEANLDTQLGALPTDADVEAACDASLATYDAPTKAELDAGLAALNDLDAAGVRSAVGLASANLDTQLAALPTDAENAAAVWDETLSEHDEGGSTGEALAAAGSAGDPWSTALPGAYGAGTAGKILGDNLNAPVGTVDTVVDAIKAKTDNLPTDPADQSAVEAAITSAHATTNGKIDAVDDMLDTELPAITAAVITNAAGADVAADIIALRAVADTIQADTDLLDDVSGGLADIHSDIAAVKGDTAAILVDTGTDGVVLPQAQADKVWGTAARALTDKAGFTLHADYDAAKTAASQTSVNDLPTNAELASALAGADDATLAAIAALNDVSSGDVQTAAAAALNAYDPPTKAELDTGLDALPTAAEVKTAMEAAGGHLALILEDTGTTLPGSLTTLSGKVDAVDDYVDSEVGAIKGVTDKLDTALELDGAVYRFTGNALEQGPAGSGLDAAETAAAVWDAVAASYDDAGSMGEKLNDAGAAADPWAIEIPGAYAAGSAGQKLGDIAEDLADGGRTDLLIDAIKGKTDALGAYEVTVTSPVADSGEIGLNAGDDYNAADGRAISLTRSVEGTPDLTGATVKLKCPQRTWEATSCTSDGTDWTFIFELTAAETAALTMARQNYEVEATLVSGRMVTLLTGTIVMTRDIPEVS